MGKKIYIKDWLVLKPYEQQTVTDSYYLKLSNEVKSAILSNKQSWTLLLHLDDEEINTLSCFLTSYFEDLISGTNIWNTFVRLHQKLYKKKLPFYILDYYYEEEINIQDISLLIWYFLNGVQEEKFIAPYNDFIIETAKNVTKVFEDAWEYAPENKYLKSFYTIGDNETDFYIARALIDKIIFQSYLFYPDTLMKLLEQQFEIIGECKDKNNLMSFLNEARDSLLHGAYTRLLGLKGKEWVAEILGPEHPMYRSFLNISQKITGFFLYKKQDDNYVIIEHIASGKAFELTKKSFDYAHTLNEVDTILFLGIVQWKGEWWFSGVFSSQPFNADLILDEKNSLTSRMAVNFLDHQSKDTEEILKMQCDAFKIYTKGEKIAFLPTGKLEDFNKEFIECYNKALNLSEKESEDAQQRLKNDGFLNTNNEKMDFSTMPESCLVFFNPKSGVEIALDVNSAFPSDNNPYFDKENSEKHILRVLIDDSISTELAMYCIENGKNKLPLFKKGVGKMYLKDIDFLLRFWKKDNYQTKPSITFSGKEKEA